MQQFYSQRQSFEHHAIRPSTAMPDSFALLHPDPANNEAKTVSFLSKTLVKFKAQKSRGLLRSKAEVSKFISEYAHSLGQLLLDGSKQLRRIYPRMGKSVPIAIPERRAPDMTPWNERGHSDDLPDFEFAQSSNKRILSRHAIVAPSLKRVKTSDRLLNEGSRMHRSPSTMDLLALHAKYEETVENMAKHLVTEMITKARI